MAINRERKINTEEKRKNKSWINGKVLKDIQVKNKAHKILIKDIFWFNRYRHLKHDIKVTRNKSNKKLIEEVSSRKYKNIQYKETWSKQNQILNKRSKKHCYIYLNENGRTLIDSKMIANQSTTI